MDTQLPDLGPLETLQIAGVTVRCARSGASSGIPILLTSPWPESLYAFRDCLPKLTKLGPVIALDLPGFGLSQGRADLMSPSAMGDFIIEVARHFRIVRMHAVGPDVGTLALLSAAARAPELFESIVGGSGATSVDLAAGTLRDIIHAPAGAFDQQEGSEIALQFITQSAAVAIPGPVLEDYRRASAGRRFADATAFVRSYPTELPRLQKLLPNIKTPVLVIAGEHDPIVPPANGQLLADHLPHCQYILLDGGHLIWEDQAAAYAEHLAAWLGGGYRSAVAR